MVTQWPLIGGLRAIYCKPHARIHSRILATFLCSYPRSPHFMLNLVVSLGQVQYYREVPNSSGGQNNSTKTCCEGYQTHSESHSFWRDIRCFWSERVILAFHMSVRLKRPKIFKILKDFFKSFDDLKIRMPSAIRWIVKFELCQTDNLIHRFA